MDDERRTASRQRSFLRGRMFFNNRTSSIDCLIRDVSATGAKLVFSETAAIPDVVDLYLPQKDQWLRAHVQWRSGGEIGVAFETAAAAPSAPASGDLAQRVEQLEAEVATLRRLIRRLKLDADSDAAAAI
jgi:hypothetical protein